MEFKVKVDDVKNFLKVHNCNWNGKTTLPYEKEDNVFNVVVTDENLSSSFFDFSFGRIEGHMIKIPVNNINNNKRKILTIKFNPFNFIIHIHGNSNDIDISDNWVKYLLKTRPDYKKALKEKCKMDKEFAKEELKIRIENLNQEEEIAKKIYEGRKEEIAKYKEFVKDTKHNNSLSM